jgi:hypothetical protein
MAHSYKHSMQFICHVRLVKVNLMLCSNAHLLPCNKSSRKKLLRILLYLNQLCLDNLKLLISLKLKLIQIIFKNLVRTSKTTPHFTITKDQLDNFVQGNNPCLHRELNETLKYNAALFIVKVGGKCTYHSHLNG